MVDEYELFLSGKAEGTKEAYLRTVRHLVGMIAQLPGNEGYFQPRQLTQAAVDLQRNPMNSEGDRRGSAPFALGYWAGCRVSDVSWLRMVDTHVSPREVAYYLGYVTKDGAPAIQLCPGKPRRQLQGTYSVDRPHDDRCVS
jgi:hypothetical protein